jgi:hypothetical protein
MLRLLSHRHPLLSFHSKAVCDSLGHPIATSARHQCNGQSQREGGGAEGLERGMDAKRTPVEIKLRRNEKVRLLLTVQNAETTTEIWQ